jgi:hypothetical protein
MAALNDYSSSIQLLLTINIRIFKKDMSMPRTSSYKIITVAIAAGFLTACASTPPSSTLLTGISAADMAAKPSNVDVNGLRAASDPVCQKFYANAVGFAKAANKPNTGGQILAATGVSVLASVVTNGLLGGVGNSVGGIAAQTAASQLIFTGGNAALSGLNSSRASDKVIIEKAGDVSCPVKTI